MAQFYGNMKNNSRSSFIFDKIYPSRTAMEAALDAVDVNGNHKGDGVFINRYVLVDYNYALTDNQDFINTSNADDYYEEVTAEITARNYSIYYIRTETVRNGKPVITYSHPSSFSTNTKYYQLKVNTERYKPGNYQVAEEVYDDNPDSQNQSITNLSPFINSLVETDLYYAHKKDDWENYRGNYDGTAWIKIYIENKERYVMVAEFNAHAPVLEIIDDAPGCQNGSAHFDARASTEFNYLYYIPNNWDMIMNEYNPDFNYNTTIDNEYYYYEQDKNNNDLWYERYVPTSDTIAQHNKTYYIITHQLLSIDANKIIKNLRYYEKSGNNYFLTQDQFAKEGKQYYRRKITKKIGLLPGDNIKNAGYYEKNNKKQTYDNQTEYPYFNRRGFNKRISTHVNDVGQGIYINEVRSTQQYPIHNFVHAGALTKTTFLPNRYYTYHGAKTKITNPNTYEFHLDVAYYIGKTNNPTSFKYISIGFTKDKVYKPTVYLQSGESYYFDTDLSDIEWFTKAIEYQENTAYYELTWAVDNNGNKLVEPANDTYRIDMYFPEFGNAVADIYDVIYEAPYIDEDAPNDEFNNLIGYCTQEQWDNYTQTNSGIYWSENRRFTLTQEELNKLSPEIYVGLYDIPVYTQTGTNMRLYSDERMKATLGPPYNNLVKYNRDISMGWALTILKRYISELRYLSLGDHGAIAGEGFGLQSDWTLEDDLAFGYVYHRPNLITNFVLTKDKYAIPNKKYYIRSGEIYSEVTGLAANTNISGRGYYELPRSYLNDSERNNILYTQCSESDVFNGIPDDHNLIGYCTEAQLENYKYDNTSEYMTLDGVRYSLTQEQLNELSPAIDLENRYIVGIYSVTAYYFWDGTRYVPSYWMQKTDSMEPICVHPCNPVEGMVKSTGMYRIQINAQDIITHRFYGCESIISEDKVALCYQGKALKRFNLVSNSIITYDDSIVLPAIQCTDIYDYDAPHHAEELEDTERYGYLSYQWTRYQIITLLFKYCNGQQYDIDVLAYYEELPIGPVISKICYMRIKAELKRKFLTESIFNKNKERFYTKELIPVVQEKYEIHNIWNEVLNET